MSPAEEPLGESAEELFETAPCGYLTMRLDGTIVRVNRTFEEWTGHTRDALVGRRRFAELLTGGGRIYHETHFSPLLHMQGSVREIALDVVRADGSRLPALVNAVVREDASGEPALVRVTVFDASDRRRYEQELVRAREAERDVALTLQRSLLAGDLPAGDGVRTEVSYQPAVRTLEVGGDWYDAFWVRPHGTVAAVVGDVVGRGIGAAATMGQLRSAVRAFASTGHSPSAVLDGLDDYARRHRVGQMTTVAYVEVDLVERSVRWSCAGHPPPVLVEPGEAPRFLWDGRSVPIEAFSSLQPRPEATVRVRPGSAIVLYTDGLIERRDEPLSQGLDALLVALERVRDDPADMAGAMLRDLVPAGGHGDDVCVLALRLPG